MRSRNPWRLAARFVLLLAIAVFCLGCNEEGKQPAEVSTATASPSAVDQAAQDQPAIQDDRATQITGYPGLEFGTPLSGIDYTQMEHGQYAEGLYAYQYDDVDEFQGGRIHVTMLITAFGTEPGEGQIEGVTIIYNLGRIDWDDPDKPGQVSELVLLLRTQLLAAYAPSLITENTDDKRHAFLSLIDEAGNSVLLNFVQGTAGQQGLSVNYRSAALRAHRDMLQGE